MRSASSGASSRSAKKEGPRRWRRDGHGACHNREEGHVFAQDRPQTTGGLQRYRQPPPSFDAVQHHGLGEGTGIRRPSRSRKRVRGNHGFVVTPFHDAPTGLGLQGVVDQHDKAVTPEELLGALQRVREQGGVARHLSIAQVLESGRVGPNVQDNGRPLDRSAFQTLPHEIAGGCNDGHRFPPGPELRVGPVSIPLDYLIRGTLS